ncbi:DUF1501 domain-containing protein [Thermomonas aquatica]|uniref:DUF1501 domain-containing protein n=1 Tax=Thermomonas aquatica TaxID=2202149 RepID=A0A5B7ZNW5_9GAMM|nr:DUF1501 domain-containing protein [Thermomonas aquatica]QDA56891.1 DUF1501 domain-containing protein [Thermomonas aquatica]
MPHSTRHDRRRFLQGLGALVATGTAGALFPQLELIGQALAAAPAPGDYRALVCIFLYGGNDSYNMLIPHAQAEYDLYLQSRGGVYDATSNPFGLGIARDSLATVADGSGKNWGLHPAFAAAKPLFDSGELAFLANIGSLVEPLRKSELASKPQPPYLFSHNDQQRQWMRGHSTGTHAANGWGGLSGDRIASLNTGLTALPPTISVSGNNLYQSGASVLPYAVASSGPTELARMSSTGSQADATRLAALEELLNASQDQQMRARYAGLGRTSITVNTALRTALDPANGGDIATLFPATPLSAQLRMIARLIKVSQGPSIGHKRQIYFAGLGGFDTHDLQMGPSRHAALLTQVAQALAAFRAGLQEIGMLNRVTTFTMSDFGRTLNSNGNGTDHAWGGVQLVMGGAAANGGSLQGRQVWGDYPLLELDGEQSMGRGRMIPTTSIQQYGATFAHWLGVGDAEMATIFPGLGNFAAPRLGFLG